MFKLKAAKVIRLIAVIATLFLVVAGTGMYLGGKFISDKMLQSNENTAMDIALLVKNNFEITDEEVTYMKSLTFNEMEVDAINLRLMDVGSGIPLKAEVRNIYVLVAVDEDAIKYTTDQKTAGFFGCKANTPLDGMWLLNGLIDDNGEFQVAQRDDIYRYTVLTSTQKEAMESEKVIAEYTSDAWGTFVTGYVPLYTTEGNYVGMLGIDMDPDQYQKSARHMVTVVLTILLCSIIIMTGLFLFFYSKYTRVHETENAEKEAKYVRQLSAMSDIEEEGLIAKGRHDLSKNVTLFYVAKQKGALLLEEGSSYDNAVEALAERAILPEKADQIRQMMNRETLLAGFAEGKNDGQIEYQRKMVDDKEAWVLMRYALYEEPSTHDVVAFIYSYDVTERVIEHQIVIKLSGMECEGIGLLDVATGQYEIKDIVPNLEGPTFVGHGDFEERMQMRLSMSLLPSERDSVPQLFKIANIVSQLEDKEVYYIHYSLLDNENRVCRKRMRFSYLDDMKKVILYSRTDITSMYEKEQQQLKQTEEALEAAKKASEAKNEFFSRMSHDMRTPMNGILGLAELAEDEDDPEVLKQNYRKIKASGEYLLGLINDTLDFQKIESGKLKLEPKVVDVREVLGGIVSIVQSAAKEKGVEFRLVQEDVNEGQFIRLDSMRLRQVFINLLSNAVKFTPSGGTVEMKVKTLSREGLISHDELTVTDTGIGMSKEFLENGIFKPFSQESNEVTSTYAGTGLGLSIAKSLVELMGGTISVESELGVGTKFTIRMDFERVNETDVKQMEHVDEDRKVQTIDHLKGKRILMAEDHPLNAEIAQKLLEKVGCVVTWVKDGKECVELFEQMEAGSFDMILMDIRMPNMTGLEATKVIRSLERADAKTIPILAMTANAYESDVKLSFEVGMNGHISKPIQPLVMYEEMAKNL